MNRREQNLIEEQNPLCKTELVTCEEFEYIFEIEHYEFKDAGIYDFSFYPKEYEGIGNEKYQISTDRGLSHLNLLMKHVVDFIIKNILKNNEIKKVVIDASREKIAPDLIIAVDGVLNYLIKRSAQLTDYMNDRPWPEHGGSYYSMIKYGHIIHANTLAYLDITEPDNDSPSVDAYFSEAISSNLFYKANLVRSLLNTIPMDFWKGIDNNLGDLLFQKNILNGPAMSAKGQRQRHFLYTRVFSQIFSSEYLDINNDQSFIIIDAEKWRKNHMAI